MDFKTAFNKSAALCARQERCCSEIEARLEAWEVDQTVIDQVLSRLMEEKFIDEVRFAGFYAHDKFRFNKWGKQKIAWHLRQKKIDTQIIQAVLEKLDVQAYGDALFQLLEAKLRTLTGTDHYKKKAALARFAASRGFEFSEIMKTLDRLL
jgi:regulatory protein